MCASRSSGGARRVAHQGADLVAHLVAALGEAFGESASDLSGRSGDEDLHVRKVATRAGRSLEESDMRTRHLARASRAQQTRLMYPSAIHRRSPRADRVGGVRGNGAVHGPERPRHAGRLDSAFGDPSRRSVRAVHAKWYRRPRDGRPTDGASKAHSQRPVDRDGASSPGRARGGARRACLRDRRTHRRARRPVGRRRDPTTPGSASAPPATRSMRLPSSRARSPNASRSRANPAPLTQLVLAAAERLTSANVSDVADDLRVSERHLRRVFRDAVGVSPKTFCPSGALPSRSARRPQGQSRQLGGHSRRSRLLRPSPTSSPSSARSRA